MQLWTIQPLEVVDILITKQEFICDSSKAFGLIDNAFTDAYNWLVKEMEKRIGPRPTGVEYPIWAWHTRNFKRKRPDLREGGYGKRGEEAACIEIDIPDNEVVLTDFDEWHTILNDSYSDDTYTEEDWDAAHDWFDSLSVDKQREVKEVSWQHVFNIDPYKSDFRVRGSYIQATFWKLRYNQVRETRQFKCK